MDTIKIEIFNDKSYIRFYHYENLREENEQLKAQIEKMKCCGNCSKKYSTCTREKQVRCRAYKTCDEWELAECQIGI
jgi:hypothetical protein